MSSLRIIFLLSFLSLSFSAQAQDAGAETAAESEKGKKGEEGIKDLPRVSTAPSAQKKTDEKKTDEKKTDEKKVDEKEADAEPELLNGVQDSATLKAALWLWAPSSERAWSVFQPSHFSPASY